MRMRRAELDDDEAAEAAVDTRDDTAILAALKDVTERLDRLEKRVEKIARQPVVDYDFKVIRNKLRQIEGATAKAIARGN